ncbi:MAG: LptF/LptG family permease [Pseudomonadota bacterium]
MSIFSRYVFRQTGGALLLILSSLTGIVWIALALRQLKIVTSSGQDAWTLISMTTLALPNLFGFIAPIALLIAVFHILNRLSSDSELIILTASGATVWHVARPLLILAAVVSAGVAFVNFYAMPASLKQVRQMIVEVRSDLISQALQPGRFSSPISGVSIHIRERTLSGSLRGILFHDARNAKEIISITAQRGELVRDGDETFLEMFDGYIVRQVEPISPATLISFKNYALDLDNFQKKVGAISWKPRERYLSELMWPDPNDSRYKRDPGQFRAEIHERFSSCLYPFAFILIALAYVGQAQSTRTSRSQALMAGFGMAALLRLGGLALNKLVVVEASAAPLMYLLPLGVIVLAILAINRNERPRPTPEWRRRLSWQIEDIVSGFRRRLFAPFARRQPGE